ncbi:MAG: hypothetical protein ACRDWI_19990 [Jiangellaceae bacterium]
MLRVAPPCQLQLHPQDPGPDGARVWAGLPEPTREAVLVLLARLIARGAVDEEPEVEG